MMRILASILLVLIFISATAADKDAAERPVTASTSDGVTVHGYPFFGDLPDTAPLLLVFHQGQFLFRRAGLSVGSKTPGLCEWRDCVLAFDGP